MSHRHQQFESALHEALQTIVARGFSDPRIRGMVTVTGVDAAPDHANATVLVSILPEEDERLTLHGLESAAPFIRRELGKLVDTRRIPELSFRIDRRIKRQAEVLAALDRVRAEQQSASLAAGWSGQQADADPSRPPPGTPPAQEPRP